MRTIFFFLLLQLAAWGHESGRLEANSECTVDPGKNSLTVRYSLHLAGPAAAKEWKELDRNGDNQLSEAERSAYLLTEKDLLQGAVALNSVLLGQPKSFTTHGDAKALRLECLWTLSGVQVGPLSHPGVKLLQGDHSYCLELEGPPVRPPVFAIQDGIPVLTFSDEHAALLQGGWKQAWKWQNRGGELDGALSSKSLWSALLLAFVLGALHGLTPGHGKTIVGAYLVGSRGTVAQAVLLGLVVTFTHTFSVILLGVACLFLFQNYLPPGLIPWVSALSGVLITGLGLTLLSGQTPTFLHHHHHDDEGHHHEHQHGHHHHHHHHAPPGELSLTGLISLGVTGGMVPCPEALAVLLSALALNKVLMGLLILLAFSSGLAAILVAIGVVMVSASRLFEKKYPASGTIARLSQFSYLCMVMMGLAISLRAVWSLL